MWSALLKRIPVPMRWYIGCLLILGLVPIGLSIWYPLDGINNFLNKRHPTETNAAVHLNSLPPHAGDVGSSVESVPVVVPVHSTSDVDWVQMFGGINSALIGWLMFYEQRRKMRLEEKIESDNVRYPMPNDSIRTADSAITEVDDSDTNSG